MHGCGPQSYYLLQRCRAVCPAAIDREITMAAGAERVLAAQQCARRRAFGMASEGFAGEQAENRAER